MEKNKSSKGIAIVASLVAIIGLSIGFAAFTRDLTITTDTTTVNQKNSLSVVFSSSLSTVATNDVVGSILPDPTPTGVSASNATINNGDGSAPNIRGFAATFTEPGQSVTYEFYVHNQSDYTAYLRNIAFNGSKTCTAVGDTTQSTVDEACRGISLSIKVGSMNDAVKTTTSVSGHSLSNTTPEKITIVIDYDSDAKTANGDFTVSFGSITLTYSTVDA